MITDALLKLGSWFFDIIWWPFGFIPDGTYIFDKFGDVLNFMIVRIYGWDFILPVSDALLMLKFSIIITYAISIYYSAIYIIKLFRGN